MHSLVRRAARALTLLCVVAAAPAQAKLDAPKPNLQGAVLHALHGYGRGGLQAADEQHVQLRSPQFSDAEPTFPKGTEPLLRSDWKFYRVGAVTVENVPDNSRMSQKNL
jgi:hypothetical protein